MRHMSTRLGTTSKELREPRTPNSPDEQIDWWALFEPNTDPVKAPLPKAPVVGAIIPEIQLLRPLGT